MTTSDDTLPKLTSDLPKWAIENPEAMKRFCSELLGFDVTHLVPMQAQRCWLGDEDRRLDEDDDDEEDWGSVAPELIEWGKQR